MPTATRDDVELPKFNRQKITRTYSVHLLSGDIARGVLLEALQIPKRSAAIIVILFFWFQKTSLLGIAPVQVDF